MNRRLRGFIQHGQINGLQESDAALRLNSRRRKKNPKSHGPERVIGGGDDDAHNGEIN